MKRMNKGDYIKQNSGSNITTFGKLLERYKNGAWKAIVVYTRNGKPARGKAAIKSTKGWYPDPVKVDPEDVPQGVLNRIKIKEQEL